MASVGPRKATFSRFSIGELAMSDGHHPPPATGAGPRDAGTKPQPNDDHRNARRRDLIAGLRALFFALGMFLLLIDPDDGTPVTLRRLIIGQTFTLVGAIFMGFAWRPKA